MKRKRRRKKRRREQAKFEVGVSSGKIRQLSWPKFVFDATKSRPLSRLDTNRTNCESQCVMNLEFEPGGRVVRLTRPLPGFKRAREYLALVFVLSLALSHSCQPLVPTTLPRRTIEYTNSSFSLSFSPSSRPTSSSTIISNANADRAGEHDPASLQPDPLINRDGSRQPQTISAADGTNSNASERCCRRELAEAPQQRPSTHQNKLQATIKRTRRQIANGRLAHEERHDQVDWPDLGRSLSVGSRVVVAAENQTVELTCDASETLDPIQQLIAGNSAKQPKATSAGRQLLVVDLNGTLLELGTTFYGDSVPSKTGNDKQSIEDLVQVVAANHGQQQHRHAHSGDEEPADYLVSLVFWYKDDNPAPIYTLDARQSMADATLIGGGLNQRLDAMEQVAQLNRRLLANAKHYNGQQQIRDRLRIETDDWPVIRLHLGRVGGAQTGDYKCRVDFRRARTVRRTTRLFVEVPMRSLELVPTNKLASLETPNLPSDSVEPTSSNVIRLNENQAGEFLCRVPEGSPKPELTWLIKRPSKAASELLDDSELDRELGAGSRMVHGRPLANTNEKPVKLGRVGLRKPLSEDDDDDAGQEASSQRDAYGQHRRQSSTTSRLLIAQLSRSLDGVRLGCRARQSRNVTAKWRPQSAQSSRNSTARSQGANWRHFGEPRELTKWLELSLNLRPETVELARLKQTSETSQTTNHPLRRAGQHNRTEVATVVGFVRAVGEPGLELSVSSQADKLNPNKPGSELATERKVALLEHEPASFVCRSRGSRPNARLSWFMLTKSPGALEVGDQIDDLKRQPIDETWPGVRIVPNQTERDSSESRLSLGRGLDRTRSGSRLVCEASNDHLPDSKLAVQVELDVRFRPDVNLYERYVSEPKLSVAATRRQLRFECRIESNPSINQLVLLVNERPLLRVASSARINTSRREKQVNGQRRQQQLIDESSTKLAIVSTESHHQSEQFDQEQDYGDVGDGHHLVELFDRAEIKQFHLGRARLNSQPANETRDLQASSAVAVDETGRKFEISRDKRRFLIDLSQFEDRPDDEVVEATNERRSVVVAGQTRSLLRLAIEPAAESNEDDSLQDLQLKCLASNELGEASSEWKAWRPAKCLVDERVRKQQSGERSNQAEEPDSLLGRLRVHQIYEHGERRLACKLDTDERIKTVNNRKPDQVARRFSWWFVPLDQVPKQLDSLLAENQSALAASSSSIIETDSSLLTELETDRLISSSRGLVTCRARHANGRDSPACLTLVTASGHSQGRLNTKDTGSAAASSQPEAPSARDCKIEPILVNDSNSYDQELQQQQQQLLDGGDEQPGSRLAISVDCSSTPNKEALIFELGVSVASAAPTEAATPLVSASSQPADVMLLDGRLDHQPQQQQQRSPLARYRGKRLLFFEGFDTTDQQQRRQSVSSNGSFQDGRTTATSSNTRRFALIDLISSQDSASEPNGLLFVLDSGNNDDADAKDGAKTDLDVVTGLGKVGNEEQASRYSDGASAKEDKSPERKELDARPDTELGQIGAGRETQVHQRDRQLEQQQQQRTLAGRRQSRLMTLTEQVELLNEFVFTLRASDLVRVSEPRAIYGTELKISKRHIQVPGRQDNTIVSKQDGQSVLPPSFQVTRSKSSSTDAYDSGAKQQPQIASGHGSQAAGVRPVSGRSSKSSSGTDRPLASLLDWGRNHEIGITMAAIGATLLLSALTLALIVLVLKSRNKGELAGSVGGASGGGQSELVLMRATSPTTSISSPPTSAESRVSPLKQHHQPSGIVLQDNDSLGLIQEPDGSLNHNHYHLSKQQQQQQHHCQLMCECTSEPNTNSLARYNQRQVDYLAPPIVGRHKCPGNQVGRQVRISLSPEVACCSSPDDSQQYLAYFGPYNTDKSVMTFGAL